MSKNKSLVRQVQDVLKAKQRFGESKHLAKEQGAASDGIYSRSTFKNYLAITCRFVKWVKAEHGGGNGSDGGCGIRTLEQTRPFVDAYLQHHIDNGYSPYTQKAIASALAKLYGCSTRDFIPTQVRHRANITRSRKDENGKSKAKFCEVRNREFVDFCRATGLRRHELGKLKPVNLHYNQAAGRYMIVGLRGKGGRPVEVPILCERAVERIKSAPAGELVWSKIPTRADIHSYRADYCRSIYDQHARPIDQIPKSERYYCRGDLKGVVYDRWAMAVASRALGHNRISVIAGHYLYNVGKKDNFRILVENMEVVD